MANNPFFADGGVIAALAALCALANGGTLTIWSGTQPADANTAPGGGDVKLSTLPMSATAFGTPVASGSAGSRVVTAAANAITTDNNAANAGTAAWFRVYQSNGTTAVFDGSVGTSGCDLNLSTTSIVAGGVVQVTSLTVTQPE